MGEYRNSHAKQPDAHHGPSGLRSSVALESISEAGPLRNLTAVKYLAV